jgi:type III restriction enzyme
MASCRRYLPDFLIRFDDGRGRDDPLNLVLEIKGYRGLDAEIKASTMKA